MNKQAIVVVNGRQVTVSKLSLGKYAQVFMALKELPKQLSELENFNNEQFIAKLPFLIGKSLPELAKITSIASGIPEKEITDELGLDDITEIWIAILEVNNIEKIVGNVKKIMARETPENSTGSTGPLTSLPENTTGPKPTS